jgi:biopolymer transport protein ExbB
VLLTQNLTKTYARASDRGFWGGLFDAVKTGGVFMIPLGIVLLVAVAMGVAKLRSLRRAASGANSYDEGVALAARGDATGVAGVESLRAQHPESPVYRALAAIARRRHAGREEAVKAVRELLIREVPRLERGLTTLAVLGAAAPMLGLLGTISGLVAMFQVITELGVNDPKMLAGGIGEALITTEAGLVIAIPALLLHNYLANRSDDLVAEVEYRATKALNDAWPG